ncbi:MAG: pirin family protein [Patescibacteria group bacterium]
MQTIFHPSKERGVGEHGWLHARYSFSFASYFDPERLQFGALRVLNNDVIDPGAGFGAHSHSDMEIITIPLSGSLAHQDSMGNSSVITTGEVQVMSAGTGVEHSEFNASKTDAIELLQIWIFPNTKNVAPRYDQRVIAVSEERNRFQPIVGPMGTEALGIHQDAYLFLADIDASQEVVYTLQKKGNGVYFFLLEGEIEVEGKILASRDALGVWDTESVSLQSKIPSRILAIEVPMGV